MKPQIYVKEIIFALMMLLQSTNTFSQAPPVTTVGQTTCAEGTFTVPVTVTGFNNVANISLKLNYDPTKIAYQSVVVNSLIPAGNTLTTLPMDVSGQFSLSYTGSSGITLANNSVLFTLTFTVMPGPTGINTPLNWSVLQGECEYQPPAPGSFAPDLTPANFSTYFIGGNVITTTQPTLTGLVSACTGSTGNIYSTTPGMTGYVWNVSGGGIVNSGIGTNSINVTWNTPGAQTVGLSFTDGNGCSSIVPAIHNLTVASVVPIQPIGPVTACSGAAGNIYTTDPGMTNYLWTITGGTLTSGGTITDNTATVTWNNAGAKSILVDYIPIGSCTTLPSPLNISVNALPIPTITGNAMVCSGSAGNIYTTETGMTGYSWTVSAGGTIISGNGTNAIDVTWNTSGLQSVSVNYINAGNCSANVATIKNVTVSNAIPVSVSILADQNPVCTGSAVTFTANPVNAGTTPGYQWQINGLNVGTNNSVFSYIPVNGDMVSAIVTSGLVCATGSPATSNAISMVVSNAIPVNVSVSADQNPVCTGSSVTFNAAQINGGTAPVYQWMVNGVNAGTNSSIFSYIPVNGDIVTTILTSSSACATGNPSTSNAITMTVSNAIPVNVIVSADQNPVCTGSTVTFNATQINGGTLPVYQWTVNGVNTGINSNLFSYIPANGDIVTTIMTSNSSCAIGNPVTSNAISMAVSNTIPVNVTVSANQNPACTGSSVTYNATPVNGGTIPFYQWQVNGVNAGTNSNLFSCAPLNGDIISVILTSNSSCATGSPSTSNAIVMAMSSSIPVNISISSENNPVCAGSSVDFTATNTNGGTIPSYQWMVNGVNAGSDCSVFSYVPANGDMVTAVLTSNSVCATGNPATSNVINMGVSNAIPVTVSIVADQNPVCAGTSVMISASEINGGTIPYYQWMVNGVNTGSNCDVFSYIPANGDIVTAILTSNSDCATANPAISNALNMAVSNAIPVNVSVSADQNPACTGSSVTFTASQINGGTIPSYQWMVNGVNAGSNSSLFSYLPADGDIVNVILNSNSVCATGNPFTSNAVSMSVGSAIPVTVSVLADQNPVCAGSSVTFTASPVNGGSIPGYQWIVNGINAGSNSNLFSYLPADGDIVSTILTSSSACAAVNPVTSNAINMAVTNVIPVSVSVLADQNPVCAGTSVNFNASPINGGTIPVYQWQLNGINAGIDSNVFSYIPADGDNVTVILTSNSACTSGNPDTSISVIMIINAIPATPTITQNNDTLTSSALTGNQWYLNGTLIPGATGQTYIALSMGYYWSCVTTNGCISDTSNNIYVILTDHKKPVTVVPDYRVYPSPCNGDFTIAINYPEEVLLDIFIYNSIGEKIYSKEKNIVKGSMSENISLTNISSGIYSVVLRYAGKQVIQKINIIK